eukprot:m.243093 g.243093  ORF g.243093 m.243093 type:complete len:538 (+) comp40234_c0_seq1:4197-5810(+)
MIEHGIARQLARIVCKWPWSESLDRSPADKFLSFQFFSLVEMLADVLSAVQSLIIHDLTSCEQLSSAKLVSASFALLHFGKKNQQVMSDESSQRTFEELSSYHRIVVAFSPKADVDHLVACFTDKGNLTTFYEVLQICLESCHFFPIHQLASFAEILGRVASSNEHRDYVVSLLDENPSSPVSGKAFFLLFLKSFDASKQVKKTTPKMALTAAVKAVLGLSLLAKRTALGTGFLETTVGYLRQVMDQLKAIESKPRMSQSSRKKAEEPLLRDAVVELTILNSFLVGSRDVKIAAIENGLVEVAHSLWSFALVYHRLMKPLLTLLVTFTGQCRQAAASLLRSYFSASSLLQNVFKLAGRLMSVEADRIGVQSAEQLTLVFKLLSNVAFNTECVSALWKSNLLAHFTAMSSSLRKSKEEKRVLLWLHFLGNLTFSKEGQKMLARLQDGLPLIADLAQGKNRKYQAPALLVIRNASFNPTARASLQNNENVLSFLAHCTESSNNTSRSLAVSALQALVDSSQKVRSIIKGINSRSQEFDL